MLVHPTLEDAYAMVVLEAMAHRLPFVVSGAPYSVTAQDQTGSMNALTLKEPKNAKVLSFAIGRP
jgi:UDP-glucose:(heptosyl)LPS alpha-1,3-glucosyltransferase